MNTTLSWNKQIRKKRNRPGAAERSRRRCKLWKLATAERWTHSDRGTENRRCSCLIERAAPHSEVPWPLLVTSPT